jgi:hypothetical protein
VVCVWSSSHSFLLITAGFTESPHRDPTACCGGFTVFHGKPLYARPRGELNSLSYSIFRFVCVALLDALTDVADDNLAQTLSITYGITPPFVENCTLRPEFLRGMGVYPGRVDLR